MQGKRLYPMELLNESYHFQQDYLLEIRALLMIELKTAIPLFLHLSHAGFYGQAILDRH
jgi:hypothetical protein